MIMNIKESLEMELRVNQSMVNQLSDDNIFKAEYKAKVEELKQKIESLNETAITVQESVDKDIYSCDTVEENDEEYEMWLLEELNGGYKGGTQSWDL